VPQTLRNFVYPGVKYMRMKIPIGKYSFLIVIFVNNLYFSLQMCARSRVGATTGGLEQQLLQLAAKERKGKTNSLALCLYSKSRALPLREDERTSRLSKHNFDRRPGVDDRDRCASKNLVSSRVEQNHRLTHLVPQVVTQWVPRNHQAVLSIP
jgi:hypothetical protein